MKNITSIVLVLALCIAVEVANATTTNQAPIADVGLPRNAGPNPIVLDGTGSYDPDNSGTEQLYVKLNSSKQTISGIDLTLAEWQSVEIPLADFGIGLTNVTQIVVGLDKTGAGSEGILFMDDIRLLYVE